MSVTHKFRLPLAFAAAALLLAGCEASVSTGGDTIKSDEAEATIERQYPGQADGLELTEISCDEGDAEVGATFDCTAKNDAAVDLEIAAEVTEVNDDTDKVGFKWEISKATSDGVAFADSAVQTLQGQGYAVASMECPEIVIEEGNEVECDTTMDDGSKQTTTITLTDDDGGFNANTSGPQPGS